VYYQASLVKRAIQISRIRALALTRREDLSRLGFKSMISGLLACDPERQWSEC